MTKYYDIEYVKKYQILHFILRKKEIIYSVWCNVENHGLCSRKLFSGTLPECKRYCKENNIKINSIMK